MVKYQLIGEVEGYRQKVYGSQQVQTSVEALEKEHYAWDIRDAYDAAWERYEDRIINVPIDPRVLGRTPPVDQQRIDFGPASIVLNSIPLAQLCYAGHQFQSAEIWAMGDAPRLGKYVPYRPAENTVECNGSPDTGWYRASNVYGHVTMEWPGSRKPPLPAVAKVLKPISTDCYCYQGREAERAQGYRFINIGRYGTWSKSVLTHHAYEWVTKL